MIRLLLTVLLLMFLALPAGAAPSAERGARLWAERCNGCHAVDSDEFGPRHRGLFGRRAGSLPGFEYSRALKASGLVWTPATLDRWLRNPEALVPGQAMGQPVSEAAVRADLIVYLATLR
jgi:cytochrome c